MNKKGFTLVELLAVIVIISVILAIIFPAVNNILNTSKETIKNSQLKDILDATYDYSLKNLDILPEYGNTKFITLNELKKHNLIDIDLKDPITKKEYLDNLVISIKNVGKNYKNTFNNSILNGSYLYKIEDEFMATEDFENNKPTFKFDGYSNTDILINLNIGATYTPLNYTVKSSKNENLSDLVVENITCNSVNINEIDTSKPNIYYINYTVVDGDGYSNIATVSVIIGDEEAPILSIPDNTTIDINTTSYNLMTGVSCIDNSNKCTIKVSGNIEFGKVGKYIIEYIATDSNGNTVTEKRVITVK